MMQINFKRRILLKSSLAAGAISVAAGAGLLTPRQVLAAWPTAAFNAKMVPEALQALLGEGNTETSADIKIKAPDIAENGAVVPVTISTGLTGVESIAVLAANNPVPLVANYTMGEGAIPFVSTRIKMGKSGDVVAVIKAGGKLYSANKGVKVTIGGCGG
ncbi:MAG: thiosulfate oxidation carrier protein SoxY [Gammaproteobacteria bacterium]|nr:thiosulfate oxidation carrier protein SoxY [Gammaproteobacteria bacterium]